MKRKNINLNDKIIKVSSIPRLRLFFSYAVFAPFLFPYSLTFSPSPSYFTSRSLSPSLSLPLRLPTRRFSSKRFRCRWSDFSTVAEKKMFYYWRLTKQPFKERMILPDCVIYSRDLIAQLLPLINDLIKVAVTVAVTFVPLVVGQSALELLS